MSLGIDEACRALGKHPVHSYAAELDPTYAAVYARNFNPTSQHVGDVTEALSGVLGTPLSYRERELRDSLGRVDLLCGGPPCQGHSDLNNYTRRSDPRNSLYDRMARAAEVLNPRSVIIENVPGVQRDRTGVFTRTVGFLEQLGYSVYVTTLDASEFGVPQARKRTFVLALQSRKHLEHFTNVLEQLRNKQSRDVRWAIDDLNVQSGEFDRPSTLSDESQRRVNWLFETNSFELPDSMRPDCHRLKQHTYKSVYGRMYPDRPAPTITTGCLVMGQGRFIHPTEPRTITPHEAARIQSFPDFFDFGLQKRTTYAKLIGNAVPPLLAFPVGLGILSS
ncbi:DNA cytosine methyltransferase [Peteryoungia ipomoeae]|uniref:DNA (cytosine-5-)-methyltransferase n=1 Tax=Peteryoungia ipomoeae TaxID=1210932 RepID=A0A4S8NXT7_9HYPH|nr:DNA cytosine methyltransferase [Peteryoungia ipomoeae]THV22288.1 DNA cytosine methyltransferase [Peteryoungia ipomoeae]